MAATIERKNDLAPSGRLPKRSNRYCRRSDRLGHDRPPQVLTEEPQYDVARAAFPLCAPRQKSNFLGGFALERT